MIQILDISLCTETGLANPATAVSAGRLVSHGTVTQACLTQIHKCRSNHNAGLRHLLQVLVKDPLNGKETRQQKYDLPGEGRALIWCEGHYKEGKVWRIN